MANLNPSFVSIPSMASSAATISGYLSLLNWHEERLDLQFIIINL